MLTVGTCYRMSEMSGEQGSGDADWVVVQAWDCLCGKWNWGLNMTENGLPEQINENNND